MDIGHKNLSRQDERLTNDPVSMENGALMVANGRKRRRKEEGKFMNIQKVQGKV